MSALSRLEGVGIQVVTSLAKVNTELTKAAGINLSWTDLRQLLSDPVKSVEIVISQWKSPGKSRLPPTWTSLFDVLKKLELNELSVQIEDYLSGEWRFHTKVYCVGIIQFPDLHLEKLWGRQYPILMC